MEAKTKYTKKELLELIKLDSERYYNLANEFYKRFVAMNRCKCCNDKLIKSGKHVLTCKHYKDAVGEFTKELRKSWYSKIDLLCAINIKNGLFME